MRKEQINRPGAEPLVVRQRREFVPKRNSEQVAKAILVRSADL